MINGLFGFCSMNRDRCVEHQITKMQLTCMKSQCRNTLQCWKYHQQKRDHWNQLLDQTIMINKTEDKLIFTQVVNDCIQQAQDSQHFRQIIKQKLISQMKVKKQNLKMLIEVMANDSEKTLKQWMDTMIHQLDQQQSNQIKTDVFKKIFVQSEYEDKLKNMKNTIGELKGQKKDLEGKMRRICNETKKSLKEIKDQVKGVKGEKQDIKGMIKKQQDEFQQELDKKQQQFNQLIKKQTNIVNNIEVIQQLKYCKNQVNINQYIMLDEYMKEIEQYQRKDQEYSIIVNFCTDNSMFDIDNRMSVIKMINALNANINVGSVMIALHSDIEWNNEILRMIIDRFTNIYSIGIVDINHHIDYRVHRIMKQWIQQQLIIEFGLWFYSKCQLYSNDDGYELMKQYNQLIKHKQYLQNLRYEHSRIGGNNIANTKQQIEQLIVKIDKS